MGYTYTVPATALQRTPFLACEATPSTNVLSAPWLSQHEFALSPLALPAGATPPRPPAQTPAQATPT